ncbi:MAG: calcium/sodium antiporter, partial [Bacteroidaceae bacterium]|nr:calcium/sodium antiporter [Bacteroidaceae bacterium]
MVSLALLIAGIVMIIVGADKLTDGAAAIAARYGISSLVIGLTVVAFGSSMPEFVISFISSLKGSTEIAIGNVVGSNIFNILFIVGCTAAVFPIKVTNRTVYKDLPFAVMSSFVLFVVACDAFIDDAQWNVITRSDGLLLICFFVVFMFYTLATARSSEGASEEPVAPESIMPVWKSVLYVLLGLAGLIFGGDFFVDGACDVARFLGVSESVIALTLVSGGTSLPELAASLMAARKRDSGMAIGNVIGSVVFNAFWILGASATVSQLPLGHIT